MSTEEEAPSETQAQPTQLEVAQLKSSLHDFIGKAYAKGVLGNDDEYFNAHVKDTLGIPLEAFAQHPQLVQITTDSDLIRTVVMESKVVYLDGDDSVRAIVKPEQNTLILRDLPSGTKLDDVIGIFERAKEPGSSSADITPVGVRSDMMDTWFVTFSSEAAARNALQAIQLVKYNDKRISARLKTTAPVKPIYTGRGGPGPQGGQQQNQPSPQGSSQGTPSPVGQPSVGAYPPRPEFYGGPISPEYASPMGMIAPPMFFAAYPGMPPQPMGPGGYPMGPPMGPGGMGMPPMAYTSMMMSGPGGKWSPSNAMPMMGMGGPMGGQGPSPRNNIKGRSQRMQYPPYEGQQGQWGNPSGHRGGGYGGGGAPNGRHLNEGGGGGYSKHGNAPYSDRSGERSNRTFRRDGGNGDGRLGSGSQDGNDGMGMGSHSGDRGDDRHNGGTRPKNGARNDARGGDIRSGDRDRRYQGDVPSAGGDSGAEHDSRGGPQGAASRFHHAQDGDSAARSGGGGGNSSSGGSGSGVGGLASRSNDRQEDTATATSTTGAPSTSASMTAQHLDQGEVSDGSSAMAVSPGPGEDAHGVAASATGVRGPLKKAANSVVARSDGGSKPDGEAGEAGSRFIKKDGVPTDSKREGAGVKPAGAGTNGGAKVPSQRASKDREARDKPKKEARQPEFDFSSASDFPMIAGGDSAVPSPTAAAVVMAQAKPTFDYAKALRRGPEETTASTAAAPVPAATPTAPTATPASSVGAAHAHAPSPSEEEAPKKKKSENGSLEDASNEPTRAGPRTGDRRSNVAETHCGADDDGATLTFGVFSAVPAVPAKLYGQHFVQTRPQAAPASAAVVQSHRPASTGIESVTSEMAGAALEPKQATSTQAPPGPQAAGAPAATSVWGAKRSFSEVLQAKK